jgi:uncharacterized cupin superfamily protein
MVREAEIQGTPSGKVPVGEGWFVLNARDARWHEGQFGAFTSFEGEQRFPLMGVNVAVLAPGQPACYYHAEDEQEDFLVLAGECLLLIEGEERLLRAWDFVHCPAWTEHVLVGAGEAPCTVLALGTRLSDDVVYPVSELARRHDASVGRETHEPDEAYADIAEDRDVGYRTGWLPGRGHITP